jgi:hypothetical protein
MMAVLISWIFITYSLVNLNVGNLAVAKNKILVDRAMVSPDAIVAFGQGVTLDATLSIVLLHQHDFKQIKIRMD